MYEETNASHYVSSRTSLWCPVCGAAEGKGCTEVKGLRFDGHNAFTLSASRPVSTPSFFELTPARKDAPRPKGWKPREWVN